jgi:NADH dehydrogenase
VRALAEPGSPGRTYELCGPEIVTLEQLVRATAAGAARACHVVRVPDFLALLQALVMGLLPGKPFSLDNFRSLRVDSVCREDGCAALGIRPRGMSAIVPTYLGGESLQARLNRYRATAAR